jgi:hypothetical protein
VSEVKGYLFDELVDVIIDNLAPKVSPAEAQELAEDILKLIENWLVSDLYA